MATKYERGSTWKTQIVYTSGSTAINCSGNISNVTIYKPDGSILLGPESGQHTATGTYTYYVSSASTDNLGLYKCRWITYFDYSGRWNYMPKRDTEIVQIVEVKQA